MSRRTGPFTNSLLLFAESFSRLAGSLKVWPVWPWFVAGWVIGALFVLMFVFARMLA